MIRTVLFDYNMRELGEGVIRSHTSVIIRRRVIELMRDFPDADWVEMYHHNGERLLSCQINRLFEICERRNLLR